MFTEEGLQKVEAYIEELKAKRKEILDAGLDTATDELPTVSDILTDIEFIGFDEDGEYFNGWAVTDEYDADAPISLRLNIDFVNAIEALEKMALDVGTNDLEFSDGEIEINIDGDVTINECSESQGASMLRKEFGSTDIFDDISEVYELCNKHGWAYVG